MWNVVLDAVLDTLKLFPFLLLSYIVIELIEHKTDLSKPHGGLSGRLGPLIGGATGIIPQCGFSVMAAKLYDHRHITVGTLLAVFLATSDEAIIVLITSGTGAIAVMPLIAIKVLVAVGVGYLADLIVRRKPDPVVEEEHEHYDCTSCGREHEGKSAVKLYFLSPLLHALKIAAFILVVNFAFGTLFYFAGEDRVKDFLAAGVWIQPIIAALIGLIPNCASSVVLTQTYLLGGITFGSMLGGLCANAGIGMVVLLKDVKHWKRNAGVLIALLAVSIAVGYAVNAVQLALQL